jgi:hypothetical protein
MKINLTEFDKTILLGMFIVTKGSIRRKIEEDIILSKFPVRQRKNARYSLKRLMKFKLLEKRGTKYLLTQRGMREAKKLLIYGAPIWGVSSQR